MYKQIMLLGAISVLIFLGCNDGKMLEVAFDVKAKRDSHQDTVTLLKTEGDFLADQINNKVQLFAEKPEGAFNRPRPDEIIRLQNTLLQMQTRKIAEQEKYIKELEDVICQIVDPDREVITE